MRLVARQVVTAVVFAAPAGACDLSRCFAQVGHGPGVLVLDGVLSVDVRVGDRTATEIVGDGDVLQPLAAARRRPARARLDLARAACRRAWPCSTTRSRSASSPGRRSRTRLLRPGLARTADLDVQRAITSQPRLEVRLTLLLWHLAGRWGRVEPGGIRLALPLTHRLLGRLVGAERPSVSHALARLSQAGLVTSRDGALHLHGTAEEHLAALADRPSARREREAADAAVGA